MLTGAWQSFSLDGNLSIFPEGWTQIIYGIDLTAIWKSETSQSWTSLLAQVLEYCDSSHGHEQLVPNQLEMFVLLSLVQISNIERFLNSYNFISKTDFVLKNAKNSFYQSYERLSVRTASNIFVKKLNRVELKWLMSSASTQSPSTDSVTNVCLSLNFLQKKCNQPSTNCKSNTST